MELYPYQQAGAAWLGARKCALLADEMGLGKSAQAIAAAAQTNACTITVVCPASVKENWRREFQRFWPADHAVWDFDELDLDVISYDKAADYLKQWDRGGPTRDLLIVDEAHMAKTHTAKRTKAIFGPKCDGVDGLVERADRVILLTGTPMPNHPAELWPALRALAPETITSTNGAPYSYWQFVSKYCKTKDNGFSIQIVGAKNHDKLKAALEPFMLRRLKSEVLQDLPEITFDELYVEGKVTGAGEEIEKVRAALEADGVEGLRKVAPHVATLRRLTGLAKVAPVVEWVREWLESTDRKIVLFAQHREVIHGLCFAFDDLGEEFDYEFIDGSIDATERQRKIDRFQNGNARIFIGQIQAAGTGITLTAASDLLFVESSWVPAENSQAAMRIHRIGQKNACLVRFATLAGSIDEQIQRAVARKTADITRIVG
jgi:SWI/SNF-related matrix-associated actin-dependent regulator 1 of chromatin subfamily A